MEVDSPPTNNSSSNNNNSKASKTGIERMIELGRELLQMSMRLEKKYANVNDEIVIQNRKMMEVSLVQKLILVNNFCHFLCVLGSIQSTRLLKSVGQSRRKAALSLKTWAHLRKTQFGYFRWVDIQFNLKQSHWKIRLDLFTFFIRIYELSKSSAHRKMSSSCSSIATRDVQFKCWLIRLRRCQRNTETLNNRSHPIANDGDYFSITFHQSTHSEPLTKTFINSLITDNFFLRIMKNMFDEWFKINLFHLILFCSNMSFLNALSPICITHLLNGWRR